MPTLQNYLPEQLGGGPFLPVHPVLKSVKSGTQGKYATPNYKALAALLTAASSGNATSPVGGKNKGFVAPKVKDEDILFAKMVTGKATLKDLEPLRLAKPEIYQEYARGLLNARRQTKGKEVKAKPGVFDRVIDVLSRPSYMGVNFVGELLNSKFSKGSNPFSAAGRGLTGKDKATTQDIFQTMGWKKTDNWLNKWAHAGLGFAGDVLLDPTTYLLGAGVVKNVGTKAAIKAGEVARLGTDLERTVHGLGDAAKVGVRVPGKQVSGTKLGDTFGDVASRLGSELRSTNPYITRRQKNQWQTILGQHLPEAVGEEAKNRVVRDLLLKTGTNNKDLLEKLANPDRDLASIFKSNSSAKQVYENNQDFFDALRADTHKPTQTLGSPFLDQFGERKGLSALLSREGETASREATDKVMSVMDQIHALPTMKRYTAGVKIPFTKLEKNWTLPGEFKTGKFTKKMEDITRGNVEVGPVLGSAAKAWKAWDNTFSTAMKHDSSLAGVKQDFNMAQAHSLENISHRINDAFDGLDRGQVKQVMDALQTGTVKGLTHITNSSGETMDKVVKDFFEEKAKIINETMRVSGSNSYKGLGANFTTGVPRKYRVSENSWDDLVGTHKLAPGINELNGEHLLNFFQKEYGHEFGGPRRRLANPFQELNPKEAMYHLGQGTHSLANRRGFIEALKELGVSQGKQVFNKKGKLVLEPNAAGVRQVERAGQSGNPLRAITERDFQGKSINDPHMSHALKALKGVQYSQDMIPHLMKILEMTNPKNQGKFMEGYANVLQRWKRINTIWKIPSYHLRNTYSDLAMNHLNGLAPSAAFRPKSGYGKAMKVLRAVAPNHDVRKMVDEVFAHFQPGEYPDIVGKTRQLQDKLIDEAGLTSKQADALTAPLVKHGDESLSALDLYNLYRQHGLESHFMNEDIARLNMSRGSGFDPKHPMRGAGDKVFQYSSVRENYFRMANFIHSLERGMKQGHSLERAGHQAADDVRKFNFDYGDITPREQGLTMAMPFYKWSRKAIPLLLTSMFKNPRIFALWNHFQDAVQTATGVQPIDKKNPLPGFFDRVPSSMIEGGMFPVASRFGDPVMSSGMPNLWRDTLPFLTTPNYKDEGARGELTRTAESLAKMLGGMLGPIGQVTGWSGYGGAPGVGDVMGGTQPGEKGFDKTKFITQLIGGNANAARRLAQSKAYNATQKDYPEGMKIDPALLSLLTGTNTQQLTAPTQLYAMKNIEDLLKAITKGQNYEAGRLTNRQRTEQRQSWAASNDSGALQELLQMIGIGG